MALLTMDQWGHSQMDAADYINKHEPWLLELCRDPDNLTLTMEGEARRTAEALGVIGEPNPVSGLTTFPEWVWFATYP